MLFRRPDMLTEWAYSEDPSSVLSTFRCLSKASGRHLEHLRVRDVEAAFYLTHGKTKAVVVDYMLKTGFTAVPADGVPGST